MFAESWNTHVDVKTHLALGEHRQEKSVQHNIRKPFYVFVHASLVDYRSLHRGFRDTGYLPFYFRDIGYFPFYFQ